MKLDSPCSEGLLRVSQEQEAECQGSGSTGQGAKSLWFVKLVFPGSEVMLQDENS